LKDNEIFDDFDDFDDEEEIIIMDDGDGNETACIVLDSIIHKGNYYMLVSPFESENDDADNFEAVILKRTGEDGDNNYEYSSIEDEDEFNEVAALFMAQEGDYELEV